MQTSVLHKVVAQLRLEWHDLITIHPSDRPWQMALAAALASGLPLMVGAWFDHLDYGLISSLGGMTFLYLPATPLHHRMVSMMALSFGMIACYACGVISHFFPAMLVPVLTLVAMLVTMLCRFYRVGPPGSMFFVMAASIAAYTPTVVADVPLKVGLLTMGCLLATLIAFFYSLVILRLREPQPIAPLVKADFDFVVVDAVVVGAFVGVSLALAQALQLERPYWVPVSCLAVIQGMSLRAVWMRQLHRLLGTVLGLLVAFALLMLPLGKWSVALLLTTLSFIIETAVMRHYGFAVIFITPLTIFLADAATLGLEPPGQVIEARLIDTVVGCAVGLVGGVCLHSTRFRGIITPLIRRAIPSRLIP